MKHWLILIVLAFALAACGGSGATTNDTSTNNTENTSNTASDAATSDATASNAAASDAADTQTTSENFVARVNNEGIDRESFDRELARRRQFTQIASEQALTNAVLNTLIEQELIRQSARGLGIEVTDEQVQNEINLLVEQAGSQEIWLDWLGQNLYTEAEIFEATRLQLITQQVRERVINMGNTSTDDTVLKVRARHILVSSEAQAQEVLTRLQNGEGFAELAQIYSRDITTKDVGGDLGFFVREDLTTPELADAAFNMQPDEIAGPIATALGYHVIQTLAFEEQPVTEVTQGLQAEARFSTWLETQRAAARIERLIE